MLSITDCWTEDIERGKFERCIVIKFNDVRRIGIAWIDSLLLFVVVIFSRFVIFVIWFRNRDKLRYFCWCEWYIKWSCFNFWSCSIVKNMIGLMNLSHPIDASPWVSNLSHLIYVHELQRSAMIFSSPCLNLFRVRADSILYWEIRSGFKSVKIFCCSGSNCCIRYQLENILNVQMISVWC